MWSIIGKYITSCEIEFSEYSKAAFFVYPNKIMCYGIIITCSTYLYLHLFNSF